MDKRKAALLAIILLAIAGFFLFDLGQYLNLTNLKAQQAALSAQVSANPLLVESLRDYPRQALHARFLELEHPASGERMGWESELPDDFVELLNLLRGDREAFIG